MKIASIIQARMNSKRFPGKILFSISGKPILQYIIDRLQHCGGIKDIIVATSIKAENDAVEAYCIKNKVACYRGPEDDVAKRFIEASDKYGYKAFVRVNGDSPLIDQRLIEKGIDIFSRKDCDLVTNVYPRTFPKGQSVEVVKVDSLINAYSKMIKKDETEHVTRFFYNHPDEFTIVNFESGNKYGDIQLSVDTQEDMIKVSRIINKMDKPHWDYSYEDVLTIHNHVITEMV